MSKKREYRIRWAWVTVHLNHDRISRQRKCLAEVSVKIFGRHITWWPLEVGEWRDSEEQAKRDIEFDRKIHEEPLPETKYIDGDA